MILAPLWRLFAEYGCVRNPCRFSEGPGVTELTNRVPSTSRSQATPDVCPPSKKNLQHIVSKYSHLHHDDLMVDHRSIRYSTVLSRFYHRTHTLEQWPNDAHYLASCNVLDFRRCLCILH
jgi:hypothetical protein